MEERKVRWWLGMVDRSNSLELRWKSIGKHGENGLGRAGQWATRFCPPSHLPSFPSLISFMSGHSSLSPLLIPPAILPPPLLFFLFLLTETRPFPFFFFFFFSFFFFSFFLSFFLFLYYKHVDDNSEIQKRDFTLYWHCLLEEVVDLWQYTVGSYWIFLDFSLRTYFWRCSRLSFSFLIRFERYFGKMADGSLCVTRACNMNWLKIGKLSKRVSSIFHNLLLLDKTLLSIDIYLLVFCCLPNW